MNPIFMQEALSFFARLVRAQIEMAGMVAQNNFKLNMGEYPSFTQHHFEELITKHGIGPNDEPTYKGE